VLTQIFASPRQLRALWPLDRPQLAAEALLLFLAAGFVVIPEPLWADLFYVIVLPLSLIAARDAHRRGVRLSWPPHLVVAVALIVWFAITLAWDVDSPLHRGMVTLWLWQAVCALVFVLALHAALGTAPQFRTRLTRALIVMAAINFVFALIHLQFDDIAHLSGVLRMGGWAETRQPILGGGIIGVVTLLALSRAITRKDAWLAAAALGGLVFIALTGSRGPGLAILAALVVQLGWGHPRVLALAILAALLLALAWLALDYDHLTHLVRAQVARGDSNRFIIWRMSWDEIAKSPWIGHGPGHRLDRPGEDFPHNLFLSTWFYSGLIGLGLLLSYLALVLRRCFLAPNRAERALRLSILAHVVLCGMTDFGQVIKGPGPLWYLLWMSTLLCATQNKDEA